MSHYNVDYSGVDNPNSFYGEFSVCSDGPIIPNQYEKIGSSIHHTAKFNDHNEEYHLSSTYSDGGIIGDMQADLTDYETENVQIKRDSPAKNISKPGTKFIKNKSTRPKFGYPQAKKQGNSIFDSESIATITDLPLPCHKSDVEAFLDDLFDRALDPKNLGKKKAKKTLLSTLDQRRLQMISNSRIEQSTRRRGLANLLHKNSTQKKSSVRPISHPVHIHDQKKMKNEKENSERKKRTKTKPKYSEHSNINMNNNNNNNSLTSSINENRFILPQVGYSSQTDIDDNTKYIRGPKHQIFDRRSNELRPRGYNRLRQMSTINFDKQEYSLEKTFEIC
ncbi:unnamed protein product, partial [Adineta steineri]